MLYGTVLELDSFEIAKSVISELDLLIEKPMAMSVEECVELESLSMSNIIIIMVRNKEEGKDEGQNEKKAEKQGGREGGKE